MKLLAFAASTLALGMVASSALAQTCSAPTELSSNATITNSAQPNFIPTTCTGDNSFTDICGGATLTGRAHVYHWHYGGANTPSGSITVTPAQKDHGTGGLAAATFDVALAVAQGSGACAAALGNCSASADNNANSSAESIALSGLTTTGEYYLIISSFSTTAANQCGPYGMTVGVLPVKLQSFSIN